MNKENITTSFKAFPLLLVIGLVGMASCQQSHKEKRVSQVLTPQLIQACIDTTLSLDKGLNTSDFMLDVDVLGTINKQALQQFIATHQFIKLAKIDSLYRTDLSWLEYRYFAHPVIRFETITVMKNGDILVTMSKVKSSDGAIGARMIFRKEAGSYKCLESAITWIS
jgi:hypothetical protein